ncbi:MAG: hypothetical protein KBI15_01715 [Candidatus Pacebacteria bacterium]|nr:hypothetical protein [Candidatus Paceibacterota bacterium]
MILYLTSTGFKNGCVAKRFKEIIKKDIDKVSFLIISVQDSEPDAFYLQETINELKNIGAANMDVFALGDKPFSFIKECV